MFAYCKDNPVNGSDPSGFRVEWDGGGTAFFPIPIDGESLWQALKGAATLVVGGIVGISVAREEEDELRQRRPTKNEKTSHEVYVLINTKSEAEYVGRTSRTTLERYGEHQKTPIGAGLNPYTIARGLTYAQTRGGEQITYEHYLHAGNNMRNSINGIGEGNLNKWFYMYQGAMYLSAHPEVVANIYMWDKKKE